MAPTGTVTAVNPCFGLALSQRAPTTTSVVMQPAYHCRQGRSLLGSLQPVSKHSLCTEPELMRRASLPPKPLRRWQLLQLASAPSSSCVSNPKPPIAEITDRDRSAETRKVHPRLRRSTMELASIQPSLRHPQRYQDPQTASDQGRSAFLPVHWSMPSRPLTIKRASLARSCFRTL